MLTITLYHRGYKESSDVKVAVKKITWDEITPAKAKKEVNFVANYGVSALECQDTCSASINGGAGSSKVG